MCRAALAGEQIHDAAVLGAVPAEAQLALPHVLNARLDLHVHQRLGGSVFECLDACLQLRHLVGQVFDDLATGDVPAK